MLGAVTPTYDKLAIESAKFFLPTFPRFLSKKQGDDLVFRFPIEIKKMKNSKFKKKLVPFPDQERNGGIYIVCMKKNLGEKYSVDSSWIFSTRSPGPVWKLMT